MLLMANLSHQAKAAADLQYDLHEQQRQNIFDQMIMDARICMHDAIKNMLQIGSRDSTQILNNTEKLCNTALIANRKVFAPTLPESDLRLMLKTFAMKELNAVPGLSHKLPLRPQIAWDQQQVTLRGIVHKGVFEECCFDGETRQSNYYYLALKDKIDIIARNRFELQMTDLDSIQLGGTMDAMKEGQSLTVICKEVHYGNTGHYAMSAYCTDPKIKH